MPAVCLQSIVKQHLHRTGASLRSSPGRVEMKVSSRIRASRIRASHIRACCIRACRIAWLAVWLALLSCGRLATLPAAEVPGQVRAEFVFSSAPFKSCHASTLAEAAPGKWVVACFGGTHEKHPDVGIWVCRWEGEKWTAPVEAANGVQTDQSRHPCWNPVLFQPESGPLWLFYKVGPDPRSWWGEVKQSDDQGRTWSAARRLPAGIVGPIKNKPVQLAGGEWLSPSSSEDQGWRIHFERSTDGGQSWTSTGPLHDGRQIGAIQPSILALGEGRLRALGRTRQQKLFQIDSTDNGRTWGDISLTDLPNPNSGTDAVTLRDGRHLLIYNHTAQGRSPLNVALSADGRSWQMAAVLEDEPKAEFSYPAIVQGSDGLVHATYTWKRQRIKHVVIDPARWSSGKPPEAR